MGKQVQKQVSMAPLGEDAFKEFIGNDYDWVDLAPDSKLLWQRVAEKLYLMGKETANGTLDLDRPVHTRG